MSSQSRIFNIRDLAATLPATAETLLTDIRLTDEQAASCRIFRVYREVPPHFHTSCDEYLYILSGRAEIVIEEDPPRQVAPGELIFFRKRVVHALPTHPRAPPSPSSRSIPRAVHPTTFTS